MHNNSSVIKGSHGHTAISNARVVASASAAVAVVSNGLSLVLLQEGRRVLLLERDLTQPDRIVGELLQPGGYLVLKKLGLEECTENIDAVKVWSGRCTSLGTRQQQQAASSSPPLHAQH